MDTRAEAQQFTQDFQSANSEVLELNEISLALVGGGVGEIAVG